MLISNGSVLGEEIDSFDTSSNQDGERASASLKNWEAESISDRALSSGL